ncbi:AAA family ATPase [Tenacibaculum agarivorans]|uniref:AAA family ATPase n=1 Tax=Tenacibaculum agarivorans TaxID=1908389 RepID=UPI00094B9872|nr:ATP-binding protein [Tenacibaculum agarivorans]
MLIEFKVSNYRSIGDEQILSLIPDKKKGDSSDNIISKGKHNALNAIAIYGSNASGKSNLLLSMSLLDKLIHLSARSSSTTKLPYDPFLLRKGWENKPTKFEVTFIINQIKYRYGLEFYRDQVVSEWLYRKSVGREVYLFLRQEDIIDTSSAFKGKNKIIDTAIEATRPNALFLSTCDMFNIDEAKDIFQWFKHFQMIDGLNTETINTVTLWDNKGYQSKINDYMTKLGLSLVEIDITTKDFDSSELPDILNENERDKLIKQLSGSKSFTIYAKHKVYNSKGKETNDTLSWKFEERESAGTNKAFHLSGPILWTLTKGGVLIIDEIEAKLHPIMTIETINLFLNKDTNPNNAQLIFATHDTNLLTYSKLRRDQIYFSEKNNWESTEIYSLSDFVYIDNTKERPDTDKEKRYFEGRYKAIPILSNFHSLNLGSDGKER